MVDLSEPDLAHIAATRSEYGLRADREFIRALYSNPAASSPYVSADHLAGGLRFSADEEREVLDRFDAEWWAQAVDDWASKFLPESYFGTDVYRVGVTLYCSGCDPAAVQSALVSDGPPNDHRIATTVQRVEYSVKELRDLATTLPYSHPSHTAAYVDTRLNRVVLFTSDGEAAASLASDPRVVVRIGSLPPPAVNKDAPLGYNLVEGGQYISGNGGVCTSGFAVQSGYGPFVLTAGHCSQAVDPFHCDPTLGDVWTQGGQAMGTYALCHNGGSFDSMLISTYGYRNNYGGFHYTSTDYVRHVDWAATSQNLSGVTLCHDGWKTTGISGDDYTWARCGVVTSTIGNPGWATSPPMTASYGVFAARACPGDSGGSVLWFAGSYGVGAIGTTSAAWCTSTGVYFTKWTEAANAWGLSLTP